MSADAQFRAFIDRILRCREAEDEAKEDTKAVYAELKAEGYDKSIVGKLIAELRNREKNSAKVDEQETLLELYRDAYQRASGTPVATHTHTRATPIPSQDGKTESEGLASAPVTEHEAPSQGEEVVTPHAYAKPAPAESLGDIISAPHSEQARFPSQGALEADPAGTPPTVGSADQFNDTGPHVFSDHESVA